MKGSKLMWSTLLGCALIVGCEKSEDKTPTGAPAANPAASDKAASEMKKATEGASETAKDTAKETGKELQKQAETASDTLKKEAKSGAEAANTSAAAADAEGKLKIVMDAIKDKKWDIADTTLKGLESNKASLPATIQDQLVNARKMLDAGKAGLATPAAPALPK